jgi:hypothetical protein
MMALYGIFPGWSFARLPLLMLGLVIPRAPGSDAS